MSLGVPELIIILLIVMLIFGVGKLSDIGAALGKGIREFRENVREPAPSGTKSDEVPKAEDKKA
jgi:sec-independent protein translocase protein TatA